MRNHRSIRTTNEGRSVCVKEEKPVQRSAQVPTAPSSDPLAALIGEDIVAHINTNLPKPKKLSLQELVEKSQKEALANHKIGSGISKEWVDTAYGGISKEKWNEYVKKFNDLMVYPQHYATIKSSYGQQPLVWPASAPPIHEIQQAFNAAAVPVWAPAPALDPQTIKEMATDITGLLSKIKVVVDPTIPENVMVTVGADGKPVMIQLQKQDFLAYKQGSK